jgi:hypothetical protein
MLMSPTRRWLPQATACQRESQSPLTVSAKLRSWRCKVGADVMGANPEPIPDSSADLQKTYSGYFDAAALNGVRSHDLRRTFASLAADEGYGDATIAELLGHARRGVTARHCIRRPDSALIASADRVSARIAGALSVTTRKRRLCPFGRIFGAGID